MQIAASGNSKAVVGEEENGSSSNNNCNKSSFMRLMEKIWNYQMPPRWIFFFFVLQTIIGIFVTKCFIVQYFRDEHLFLIILGNLAFLYLWMLATGRTILRLRTPQEVSEKTSFTLLKTTGVFFLVSGILMCIGENGVRNIALGETNWNSIPFNIAASTAFMLGIYNLILASKTNVNRFLTFLVLLANGLSFLYGSLWVTDKARFFQRSCWGNPMCIYSMDDDFAKSWILQHGVENAIPFGSIVTFDFIRTVPVFATIFLAGCVALTLIYAMIKIGMTEEEKLTSKLAKKVPKKNYVTASIGFALTLISFLAVKCLCDANSFLYLRRMTEIPLAIVVLTSLGLLGMGTLNGRTPTWARALLMVAAAATFIATYSTLDSAAYFEIEASKSFRSVLNSNCTGGAPNSNNYNYPAQPAPAPYSDDETTTAEAIQGGPNDACFHLKDGWKKAGIICIPKEKFCDGVVDIVEPVEVCRTIPNHYMYTGERGAHFIDEIFCPSNGINSLASTMKAVNWLSMLLSLAMVVALAFMFRDDNDVDEMMVEDYDNKEKMAFLHVLDKFHGTWFSKGPDEDIQPVQEDTPIIKKKLDSPC